jgi:hypothetical protein
MAANPPSPPPKRKSIAPDRLGEYASEKQIKKIPKIDSLPVPDDDDTDDFDWVQNVPGRPSPYANTWNLVYAVRTYNKKTGNWETLCIEGGDGKIEMNGKFQELNSASTPHGQLRKPPVCHITPWALVSLVIKNMESKSGKTASEPFKKYACWGNTNNLRTGHNACNAGGTKATAQNHTSAAYKAADVHVDRCIKDCQGNGMTWHM